MHEALLFSSSDRAMRSRKRAWILVAVAAACLLRASTPGAAQDSATGGAESAKSHDDPIPLVASTVQTDPLLALESRLLANGGSAGDAFGRSVSLDGNTAVIGAPGDDLLGGDEGSVYVFRRQSGSWVQTARLNAPDRSPEAFFGHSVALSGSWLVVGAYAALDDTGAGSTGAAYLYRRYGDTWAFEAKLTPEDASAGDFFGYDVDVSSNRVLVGSPLHRVDGTPAQGAVYVFKRRSGDWAVEAKLTASDGTQADLFGESVALDRETALVGARFDDVGGNVDQGSAYVFQLREAEWFQQSKLTVPQGEAFDQFGFDVALSGHTLVVGAPFDDDVSAGQQQDDVGAAFVFVRDGARWRRQQKLTPALSDAGDLFGHAVSVHGDLVAAAAIGRDLTHVDQGAAHVFRRYGDQWSEAQRVLAPFGRSGDVFGSSLALHDDEIVIGIEGDSIGGDLAQGSAVVYIACRDVRQEQLLLDPDGAAQAEFGSSVAINGGGEVVVVGTPFAEPGGADDQGMVSIYERAAGDFELSQTLVGNPALESQFGYHVAIDGLDLAVSSKGAVDLYRFDGSSWGWTQRVTVDDEVPGTVALSQGTLATSWSDPLIGSGVDVYVRRAGVWEIQLQLEDAFETLLGGALDLDGNTLVISKRSGALGDSSVLVWERIGDVWIERQELTSLVPSPFFGSEVAHSGDTILVGSDGVDSPGVVAGVAAFERQSGVWTSRGRVLEFGGADSVGQLVVQGEMALVSGLIDSETGDVHVLTRDGGGWTVTSVLSRAGSPSLGSSLDLAGGRLVLGEPDFGSGGLARRGGVRVAKCAACSPPGLNPTSIDDYTIGELVDITLEIQGERPPFSVSVSGGHLPRGLDLDQDATLAGILEAPGRFVFELSATDAALCTRSRTYRLDVIDPCPELVVRPGSLRDGRVGELYEREFTVSGGVEPYTFKLSGRRPDGLQFSEGHLRGILRQAGEYPLRVDVTDANGCEGRRDLVLTVHEPCSAVTIDPQQPELARLGEAYEQIFVARGGEAPYRFVANAATLPPGLVLDANGSISGIPTSPGTYNFLLRVIDATGCRGQQSISLQVEDENLPPTAVAGPDRDVTVGMMVSLDGSGSTDPEGQSLTFTWTLVSAPVGSVAMLAGADGVSPSLVVDLPGVYAAQLIVDDGGHTSAPDVVELTAVAPVVTIVASDASALEEGPDVGTFALHRTGDTSFELTVETQLSGSATNAVDYEQIPASATFPTGSSHVEVIVAPIDDALPEDTQNVIMRVLDGVTWDVGSPSDATVDIADNDLQQVFVATTDFEAAESGGDTGRFSVRRIGPTAAALTVSYEMSGVATNGVDYVSLSGEVTIPAGDTMADVEIVPIDDPEFEGTESVVLTVVAGADYDVTTPSGGTITIVDDERPVVTVRATLDASEAGPVDGAFEISRTGPTQESLAVSFGVLGDAENGVDFETIDPAVVIPVGESSVLVPVRPIDDVEIEGAETVVLALAADSEYELGAPALAAVTLADDDLAVITIEASDPSAGEAGPDNGVFVLRRSAGASQALDVFLSRTGSASNSDYSGLPGGSAFLASFDPGSLETVLTVSPEPDNLVEGEETIIITVDPALTYVVGSPSEALVTIADDPAIVEVTSDGSASEAGLDPAVFTFTRTGGDLTLPLNVHFSLTGTAANNSDYEFTTSPITIPAGASSADLVVLPKADNSVEGNETIVVTVQATTSVMPGVTSSATVVLSDDPPVVRVVAVDASASELGPDPGELVFERTGGDLSRELPVFVSRGGSATNGVDYESIGGSVFIVAIPAQSSTASVVIVPRDDPDDEGFEDVILTIMANPAYLIGDPDSDVVTIADDD